MEHVLAIDLGGTRMRGAVVGIDGVIVRRDVRPTPKQDLEPLGLFALLTDLANSDIKPSRAVVGVPGRVDHHLGKLDHAPNLPSSWAASLTESRLSVACGCPVRMVNDADLAAVGEAYFGAGRGYTDVAYLTLSTGVGGGVLAAGKLIHGRRSLAEVGHMIIDRMAHQRGEPATFEQLASGTALSRLAAAKHLPTSGKDFVALVRAGNAAAIAVFEEVAAAAAIGIRNVAFAFSPEIVVIGGGLGLNDDLLHPTIREHLDREGPPAMTIALAKAQLGDDAGLVGAAALHLALGV